MPKYLFSHDERDNSFPERYRVIVPGEDAEFLRETESLTGTVLDTEAIGLLEDLLARCGTNPSMKVELVDAPFWRFIELRYRPAEAEAEAEANARPPGAVVPGKA